MQSLESVKEIGSAVEATKAYLHKRTDHFDKQIQNLKDHGELQRCENDRLNKQMESIREEMIDIVVSVKGNDSGDLNDSSSLKSDVADLSKRVFGLETKLEKLIEQIRTIKTQPMEAVNSRTVNSFNAVLGVCDTWSVICWIFLDKDDVTYHIQEN
jgi:hypothetical protein